jgi:hypothetical protein
MWINGVYGGNVKVISYDWNLHKQNYNTACGFVGVWNWVSDIKGRTKTEGISEQDAEKNIWTQEWWCNRKPETTA